MKDFGTNILNMGERKYNILGMEKIPNSNSFMGITKLQFTTQCKIWWYGFKSFHWIKLGDWTEALIHTITLGFGERISLYISRVIFNTNDCGCCRRKEWLNRLTNRFYNGDCDRVKLF